MAATTSSAALREGDRICLGGKANVHRLLHSGSTRSFGGKGGPRQRPELDATHLIADPDGGRNSFAAISKRPDDHQNHDADHQQRRDLVGNAVETRRPRVPIHGKVLGPYGEQRRDRPTAERREKAWRETSRPLTNRSALKRRAQTPSTQLASIAGVVMYRSSLRSITLKVSDCSEPGFALRRDRRTGGADRAVPPSRR